MREKWIDNAKGIAIILVIVGHVGNNSIINTVYGFHLLIFFVLAGYTLRKEKITKDYINKKFTRLMTPYFYTCFAVILMDILNSYILNKQCSLETAGQVIYSDLLRCFMASGAKTNFVGIEMGSRIGAIWFLPAMFFALLVVQIVLNAVPEEWMQSICVISISLMGYISGKFIWMPFSIQSAMFAASFRWFGYYIKSHELLSRIKKHFYLVAVVVFVAGVKLGYCNIGYVIADMNDLIVSVIVGLAASLLVYGLSRLVTIKLLQRIGQVSLYVMCVHLFALETLWNWMLEGVNLIKCGNELRNILLILLHIICAIIGGFLIDACVRWYKKRRRIESSLSEKRQEVYHISIAFFLIAILAEDFALNMNLRTVIESCSIVGGFFLSGYAFEENFTPNIKDQCLNILKTFGVPIVILIYAKACRQENTQNLRLLQIVVLIVLVRIIYMFLTYICKTKVQSWSFILGISMFGYLLGMQGHYLPMMLDIVFFVMLYYKLGVYFREQNRLVILTENSLFYFLFSVIWVYMIYAGGMNLTNRNYNQYGLSVFGSLAGTLLIYMFCNYISDRLSIIRRIMGVLGNCAVSIVVIHALFGDVIGHAVGYVFGELSLAFMVSSIAIQLIIGVILSMVLRKTGLMQFC